LHRPSYIHDSDDLVLLLIEIKLVTVAGIHCHGQVADRLGLVSLGGAWYKQACILWPLGPDCPTHYAPVGQALQTLLGAACHCEVVVDRVGQVDLVLQQLAQRVHLWAGLTMLQCYTSDALNVQPQLPSG
jgi:hypothetical protein